MVSQQTTTLEDVRIVFRNFSGAENRYNRKGDRNFSVVLTKELADQLAQLGYNVKTRPPREEGDEPLIHLAVKVKFPENGRPPRVVLISSSGRRNLDEDSIGILDWADIQTVDMIIRPFQWELNGDTGITAYLNAIYVTIREDDLERKYSTFEGETN